VDTRKGSAARIVRPRMSRNRATVPPFPFLRRSAPRHPAFCKPHVGRPCTLQGPWRLSDSFPGRDLWHGACAPNRSMRSSEGRGTRFPVRRRREALSLAARALLLLGTLLVVAIWGWLRNADSRALAGINPDLRRELFLRSRAEAEVLCAPRGLYHACRTPGTVLS